MANLELSVVAADRAVVDDTATAVIVPGALGYFGVWAGHEPMVMALKAGVIEYEDTNRQRHHIAISGGFAEVSPARVMILADTAAFSHEIDVQIEEQALEQARRALRGEESSMTLVEATDQAERSLARMRAAKVGR